MTPPGAGSRHRLPRLYLITDERLARTGGPAALYDAVQAAVYAGVRMVQFRDKTSPTGALWEQAHDLAVLVGAAGGVFLVNDRADLALALDADGVHRPGRGLPFEVLRRLLGPDLLIGASCHDLDEAVHAARAGADFITLSPIFATDSKPGYGPALGLEALARVCASVEVPVYALGGVGPEQVAGCLEAGAWGVAVMGGIMAAADPAEAARRYLEALASTSPSA